MHRMKSGSALHGIMGVVTRVTAPTSCCFLELLRTEPNSSMNFSRSSQGSCRSRTGFQKGFLAWLPLSRSCIAAGIPWSRLEEQRSESCKLVFSGPGNSKFHRGFISRPLRSSINYKSFSLVSDHQVPTITVPSITATALSAPPKSCVFQHCSFSFLLASRLPRHPRSRSI